MHGRWAVREMNYYEYQIEKEKLEAKGTTKQMLYYISLALILFAFFLILFTITPPVRHSESSSSDQTQNPSTYQQAPKPVCPIRENDMIEKL